MNDPALNDPAFEQGVQATLRAMRIQDEARERFAAEVRNGRADSAPATVLRSPAQVELARLCRQARMLALLCWLLALCCIGMAAWLGWRSKKPQGLTPRPPLLPQSSSGMRSTFGADRPSNPAWFAMGYPLPVGSPARLSTALATSAEATADALPVNGKEAAR